ncbi:Alpha/Beta hydrolase protein [Dissophora ornata]|nr:Alpha/Beta hydrolase protein [Dissophora ornata]
MSLQRRGSLAFPIRNLRRYVGLISRQLAIGASLIIKHPFIPPPVPTWPLHLAVFVAVMRATADIQEHIVEDISDIRRLIDTFFHYLPKLPQMQIVPFKVPIPANGRGFPGAIEQLERSESGHRTVPGQWISDWTVWDRIIKMPLAITAKNSKDPYAAREGEKVILYTHGGGYFICSSATHREMLWRMSRTTGRRIFAVDYRLAPEHPYPAALQDAAHAFSHLTDPKGCGFDPENVTAAGDSAGGGLAIALMMYQRDSHLAMASKALLLSPWLDLTMSCDSWVTNSMDYLPSPPKSEHKFNPISFYCSGRDKIKTLARHPYISPLWGDLEGLPPLLIQCGDVERLRDECILFTYKAGGSFGAHIKLPFQPEAPARHHIRHVELDMYPGMVHVFQAFPFLPESSIALERMLEFMQRKEAEAKTAAQIKDTADNVKALQADQGQVMMERLMEELVEQTVIKSVQDLPLHLQLREDDARPEGFEGDVLLCTT